MQICGPEALGLHSCKLRWDQNEDGMLRTFIPAGCGLRSVGPGKPCNRERERVFFGRAKHVTILGFAQQMPAKIIITRLKHVMIVRRAAIKCLKSFYRIFARLLTGSILRRSRIHDNKTMWPACRHPDAPPAAARGPAGEDPRKNSGAQIRRVKNVKSVKSCVLATALRDAF